MVTDTLYRYRSIADAEPVLKEHTLWYSSLANMNDPLEGRYELTFNHPIEDFIPFFEEMFRSGNPQASEAEISQKISTILAKGQRYIRHELSEMVKAIQGNVRNNWSFCCFSKANTNILMWSHYAADHQGCCIEFSFFRVSDLGVILPVSYTALFPTESFVKTVQDEAALANLAITTKWVEWSYENEYRLVRPTSPGVVNISGKTIRRVIFGLNTKEEDKAKIRGWCAGTNIKFAQAILGRGFEILVEPL